MTTAEWRRRMRRRLSGVAWGALLLAVGAAEGAPQGGGPAIQTVSPEEGPAGTEVVIRGEDFGLAIGSMQGTSGVSFGGVWASPEFWSEGEIRVEVPAGAESGPVAVTVGGVASDGVEFTVTAGEEAGTGDRDGEPGAGAGGDGSGGAWDGFRFFGGSGAGDQQGELQRDRGGAGVLERGGDPGGGAGGSGERAGGGGGGGSGQPGGPVHGDRGGAGAGDSGGEPRGGACRGGGG